ncbi:hypothetical protein CPC08DRAFT_727605 [Agrocybe pediades]|nr:hypothetical protein CPC08DRAFT_727605 [Agrocybe pediades]
MEGSLGSTARHHNLGILTQNPTMKNPFLDVEAAVATDEEEEDEEDCDKDDFIVDDSVEINDEDFLNGNGDELSRSLASPAQPDTHYDTFLERAQARAAALKATRDTQGILDDLSHAMENTNRPCAKWVRIRLMKGKLRLYAGDLALAIRTDEPHSFDYWIIPRLEAPRGSDYWITPRVEVRSGCDTTRPVPALFIALHAEGCMPTVRHGRAMWSFQGLFFTPSGFLIVRGPSRMVISFGGQVLPTPPELDVFSSCEVLTEDFLLQTKQLVAQSSIATGDRVACIGGALQGLIGRVIECREHDIDIYFESLDIQESVLRCEVRKHFRVGDRVVITMAPGTAQEHTRKGWVIQCLQNTVEVFDRTTQEEVRFDKEAVHHRLPDLSRTSSFDSRRFEMRHNPNHKFINKLVMVVGRHHSKGATGIIRDTTVDGYAFVALNIFNRLQNEKIKLSDLLPGANKTYLLPIVLQDRTISSIPNLSPPVVATEPLSSTPMPSPVSSTPLLASTTSDSDTWNPASRTPCLAQKPGLGLGLLGLWLTKIAWLGWAWA